MMLRCAIIDDEPLAVELMESYVRKTPFLTLCGSFGSGRAAFEALSAAPVDLLFCDIQMPELDGMELTRMLPAATRVIFTTAFSRYAVEGFRVNAVDYLLKPISYNDFLAAARKALDWFALKRRAEAHSASEGAAASGAAVPEHSAADGSPAVAGSGNAPAAADGVATPRTIFVRTEYRLQQIELARILYIEGLKDYVKIHVEGEAHPVLSLMSLKSLEEQLPADRFIRVHRSYIVQPARIRSIERNRLLFGRDRVPLSERYREAFFDFLARHALLP